MFIADPARGEAVPRLTYADGSSSTAAAPERRPRRAFEGVFCSPVRKIGIGYVAATIPVAALGGLLVHDARSYILVFVLLGSAVYTTPALAVTGLAQQRAAEPDRRSWQLWLAAIVSLYVVGFSMYLGTVTGVNAPPWSGVAAVLLIGGLLTVSVIRLARSRSGGRPCRSTWPSA